MDHPRIKCVYCGESVRHVVGLDKWHRSCRMNAQKGVSVISGSVIFFVFVSGLALGLLFGLVAFG